MKKNEYLTLCNEINLCINNVFEAYGDALNAAHQACDLNEKENDRLKAVNALWRVHREENLRGISIRSKEYAEIKNTFFEKEGFTDTITTQLQKNTRISNDYILHVIAFIEMRICNDLLNKFGYDKLVEFIKKDKKQTLRAFVGDYGISIYIDQFKSYLDVRIQPEFDLLSFDDFIKTCQKQRDILHKIAELQTELEKNEIRGCNNCSDRVNYNYTASAWEV